VDRIASDQRVITEIMMNLQISPPIMEIKVKTLTGHNQETPKPVQGL
jgi:hypothetical protein